MGRSWIKVFVLVVIQSVPAAGQWSASAVPPVLSLAVPMERCSDEGGAFSMPRSYGPGCCCFISTAACQAKGWQPIADHVGMHGWIHWQCQKR
jgi:hypothetical protein